MAAHDQEQTRFVALWRRSVGDKPDRAKAVYAVLVALYHEPHRHYHTLTHIRHCLCEFDQAVEFMDDPDAVEMAIWFHDAIYTPNAMDNEQRSADLFQQWAGVREHVRDLIMATTHRTPPSWRDGHFIVDIDLSSFGLPWVACEQDGRRIRAECAHLSDDEYYPGHLRFLLALQSRRTFFFTDFFQQRYGQTARENINRIIEDLRVRGYGTNE